ncbi:MAG: right-handed parallel beta-helix repeat-containing protein, partial [Bacteroidales bacterium]
YVGGELTSDATYFPANNPYIVTQDLNIAVGITLTILPGVELLFESGTGLISNGTLIALGTSDQKIKFSARSENPAMGQWSGILFNKAKSSFDDSTYISGSVISHAIISKANYSITLDQYSTLLIENSLIEQCAFGINILESGYNTIRNCTIDQCNFAIFIAKGYYNAGNNIYGNTISKCNDVGVFINSDATHSQNNIISNNTITACSIGLHIGNYSNHGPGYNTISGNTFNGNKDAIKLFQAYSSVHNNYFMYNRNGIIGWQSKNNYITENLFSRNTQNAITLTAGSSNNSISYNSMNFNKGGALIKPDSSHKSTNNSFVHNTVFYNSEFSFQIKDSPQGLLQFNNIGFNGSFQSFKNEADSILNAEYCFWGSTSEHTLDSIIYDKLDEPSRGEVFYQPLLDHILITAPVPPPCHVKKQLIGNSVFVSWDTLDITDFGGYKVYHGNNNGIVFEHSLNNLSGTSIKMGNIPIDTPIAVTAFDAQADGKDDQTEGYESDFAFAEVYPYAGPDTAICTNAFYSIANSTANNFTNLVWATTGDGAFDNPQKLHPVYLPGIQDYANGFANLSLKADYGLKPFIDSAHITFKKAPDVFAGNDTLIANDSTILLASATAFSYGSILWTSSGDGTFDSDTINNPTYTPGPGDINIGNVTLTITAFSFCGNISDQIVISIVPGYSISGRVHSGSGLAANSTLYLYRESQSTLEPLRTGLVLPDGHFDIKSLFAGTYYLYAVPNKKESQGYLPTYYFNDVHWGNAYTLTVNTNIFDLDLELAKGSVELPKGDGSISGYCTTLPGSVEKCSDITVLLYDREMKRIFDWALVHEASSFRFGDLPFGKYTLVGEKAGATIFHSEVIVLSLTQPSVENVELLCASAGYKFTLPGSISTEPESGGIAFYPNPATDRLFIGGLDENQNYTVRFINIQGIAQNYIAVRNGSDEVAVNIAGLKAGFYMVEIYKDQECILRSKIVKK